MQPLLRFRWDRQTHTHTHQTTTVTLAADASQGLIMINISTTINTDPLSICHIPKLLQTNTERLLLLVKGTLLGLTGEGGKEGRREGGREMMEGGR